MSKTAIDVTPRKMDAANEAGAIQRLYKLSEAVEYGWGETPKTTRYVVASGVNHWAHETYIFPADSSGAIIDWLELGGSFKGDIDHERAIRGLGFEVVSR